MSASDFHKYIMIKEYNSADVAILYTYTYNLFTYILKDLVDYTKSRVFFNIFTYVLMHILAPP